MKKNVVINYSSGRRKDVVTNYSIGCRKDVPTNYSIGRKKYVVTNDGSGCRKDVVTKYSSGCRKGVVTDYSSCHRNGVVNKYGSGCKKDVINKCVEVATRRVCRLKFCVVSVSFFVVVAVVCMFVFVHRTRSLSNVAQCSQTDVTEVFKRQDCHKLCRVVAWISLEAS